jgi:fructose-specific phosphotransferase system component IIB
MIELDYAVAQALIVWGEKCYQWGLEDGLRIAEQIMRWLPRRPQSKQITEIQQWAEQAIAEARRRGGKSVVQVPTTAPIVRTVNIMTPLPQG